MCRSCIRRSPYLLQAAGKTVNPEIGASLAPRVGSVCPLAECCQSLFEYGAHNFMRNYLRGALKRPLIWYPLLRLEISRKRCLLLLKYMGRTLEDSQSWVCCLSVLYFSANSSKTMAVTILVVLFVFFVVVVVFYLFFFKWQIMFYS